MNPLLDTIARNLAHGTGASALPSAPVVPDAPGRATIARRQVGAALHGVARRIEPRDARRVETAHFGTA